MECKLLTNGLFLYPEVDKTFQSKPCCHFRYKGIEKLDLQSMQNTFSTPQRIEAIESLANNEKYTSCNTCWKHEDVGYPSMRTRINNIDNFDTTVDKITYLEFNTGNTCNIECIMCEPADSMRTKKYPHWDNVQAKARGYTKADIDSIDFDQLSNLQFLKATGGETFYTKSYWYLLEKIIEKGLAQNISLICVTNNTITLDKDKLDILKQFQRINIYSSVDAVDDLCGVIRAGSNWKQVSENILQLIDLHKQYPEQFIHTTPHGVVQFGNILQLGEIVKWWHSVAESEYTNRMYFRILSDPKFYDVKYTCDNIKNQAVELYSNTKELVHVADYCKYNKDSDNTIQQQCVTMFEQACKLNDQDPNISHSYRELKNA